MSAQRAAGGVRRLPAGVELVRVNEPASDTTFDPAQMVNVGTAKFHMRNRFTLSVPNPVPETIDTAAFRWVRFDGRRWVPVHPTLADRLGISRAARMLKRTLRRLRQGQKLFGVDREQEFAAFAAKLQAKQRAVALEEGAHQDVFDFGHTLRARQNLRTDGGQGGPQFDGVAGLHHDHSVTAANRDLQDDHAVGPGRDATILRGDDSHSSSPSGSNLTPKVAEAGESGSTLSGGGHTNV